MSVHYVFRLIPPRPPSAADLRREADLFMPGYLIPNLLPTATARMGPAWGELGSRVRGICYNHTGKGYGFIELRRVHRHRGRR